MGNGYLSGNMLVSFPFEDGQRLGCEYDSEIQTAFNKCFVDAGLYLDSESAEGGWPSVHLIETGTAFMSFAISANGDDVVVTVSASHDKFPIASGTAPWGHYTVVMSSEGIRAFCSMCSEMGLSSFCPSAHDPSSSSSGRDGNYGMRLCAKCIAFKPKSLNSIRVFSGSGTMTETPDFVISGNMSIAPGHNMRLLEPNGGVNGMVLDARPGAGLGKMPCECASYGKVESQIFSQDGHTRIFNDTCYDIEPGFVSSTIVNGRLVMSRKLVLHAKCTACCTCDMYESIVNDRLSVLADAIRSGRSDIKSMLDSYESSVKAFNRRIKTPDLSDVSISMSGMPAGRNLGPRLDGSGVAGSMSRCAFSASIRNSSFSEIMVAISSLSGSDVIVEATASWSDKTGSPLSKTADSALGIIGSSFKLYPGRSLSLTFVSVKGEMGSSVGDGKYTGAISAFVSYKSGMDSGGNDIMTGLGTISRSVEV